MDASSALPLTAAGQTPKGNLLGVVGTRIIGAAELLEQQIRESWNEEAMERIRADGASLKAAAEAIEIKDQASYDAANNMFTAIAQYLKRGAEFIEPVIEAAHSPHKLACDIRTEFRGPGEAAQKTVNRKIIA